MVLSIRTSGLMNGMRRALVYACSGTLTLKEIA
jgi:hypothetical protein